MKTKKIFFCLLLSIIYLACADDYSRVGLGIQPEEDKISVFDTTVIVGARTIEVDSVYAKTVNGFLGEYFDPSYGNIKSSFICQYYPSIGFPYLDSIVDNKIESVYLNIYYYSYLGDSVAPMEVSVYRVTKALNQHFYTNANPEDYCDLKNPIGKYAYTARNLTIPQEDLTSVKNVYSISIPLPVKIGQDYLDRVLKNELNTLDEFLEFFPGTYITTTFGTGSMISVLRSDINLLYKRRTILKDEAGNDSIGIKFSTAAFSVTKEITQLNRFVNKNPSFLFNDNSDSVFLKTPAGVYTELTIPIKEIVKGIGTKKFSSVKLTLKAYLKSEWEYALQFPGSTASIVPLSDNTSSYSSKLLLIEPDSVTAFFEMKKVADSKTAYTTQFNSSNYTYEFSNIANIVQNAIEKAPDKDLKLWLIPVLTSWYYNSSQQPTDYLTTHYLYPSGVTLKRGGDNLKVRVIATDLKIND